jgi:hypothetical protein
MVMGMTQKGISIKQTTNLMKLRCHGAAHEQLECHQGWPATSDVSV